MFVTFAIDFFDKTLPQQSPLVTFVGQYLYWTYEQVQWSKKIVVLNLRKNGPLTFVNTSTIGKFFSSSFL